ncbi:MAG: hypothetical protein RL186_787 [Pseudomonadota bacterium]|jgi:hypothetical protein
MTGRGRSLWAALLALCAVLLGPSAAFAHRMDVAMSVVEINPISQKLEVSHKLYAHDLEGALGAGSVSLTWFETKAAEQALLAYCAQHFSLATEDGQKIALNYIGLELLGDQIALYFDAPAYSAPNLRVHSTFLHERSDAQINYVNVRAHGQTLSAVFAAGDRPKLVAIAQR